MHINFTIPIWLLVVLALPVSVIVLFLAFVGFMFLWSFRGGFR